MRRLLQNLRSVPFAIASLALACATAFASARETTRLLEPPPQFASPPLLRALPAAVTRAVTESGRRVVTVIAADIDADGDLDVVASDGSLDLLVWTNDGAGHLTRRRPMRSTGWRDDPAGSTLHGRDRATQFFTHDELPSIDAGFSTSGSSIVTARLTDAVDAFVRVSGLSTRTPRAPPSVSRLS